jgi:hypothetical protein
MELEKKLQEALKSKRIELKIIMTKFKTNTNWMTQLKF